MQDGAVSYHDPKKVKVVMVQKNKELIKKLEKTKSADTAVDWYAERRARDEEETLRLKKELKKKQEEAGERRGIKKKRMQKAMIVYSRMIFAFLTKTLVAISKNTRTIYVKNAESDGNYVVTIFIIVEREATRKLCSCRYKKSTARRTTLRYYFVSLI